jgi:hypothetical protein
MMLTPRMKKIALIAVAGATLLGTVTDAFAVRNRYTHYRAGPAIAGAALGILGAATAGIAGERYYNGYPAYTYGPGYGYDAGYGYDYHPGYGYYGPY